SGYSVYFSDGESSPHPEKIASYLARLEERTLLFFDHAGHDLNLIAELSERIRDLEIKPVILSDHFKSGQQLSLQNRPTGLAVQD
ncbi:MAG: hypothetical protein WBD89_11625, partial [Candidatus Sulfotelmatobacter sp.]